MRHSLVVLVKSESKHCDLPSRIAYNKTLEGLRRQRGGALVLMQFLTHPEHFAGLELDGSEVGRHEKGPNQV